MKEIEIQSQSTGRNPVVARLRRAMIRVTVRRTVRMIKQQVVLGSRTSLLTKLLAEPK